MRILVTGKNGQLGRSIYQIVNTVNGDNLPPKEFIFVGRDELDLSSEISISNYFNRKNKFDVIINCAAYTAVDGAEKYQELADKVNHLAVKQLAEIASQQTAKLIHISTDYVFDGESGKPYEETDETNPINVYGKTKLAGEVALIKILNNAIIIRTSWVYSDYGVNFVKTMLRLGQERNELNVVNDQTGSPTYAADLANAILDIVHNIEFKEVWQKAQVYHYSNTGQVTWHDFAREIFKIAKVDCKVNPITTEQYPTPAQRPKNTLMDTTKVAKMLSIHIPDWVDSLSTCIKILQEQKQMD